MQHFYDRVFQQRESRIGAATTAAKIATFVDDPRWLEMSETYVLFGDPAMKLRFGFAPRVPEIAIGSLSANSLVLHYDTEPDFDYVLLATEDLSSEADWVVLPGGPHNSGRYTVSTASDKPPQFFRVTVKPRTVGNDHLVVDD